MIDTHCHIDAAVFDGDRDEVLARAADAGVTGLLVPATRPRGWRGLVSLVGHVPRVDVRVAIGVHPQCVPDEFVDVDVDVDALAARIADEVAWANDDTTLPPGAPRPVVAVGECGLDGPTGGLDVQEAVLRAHVRAARACKLPLVVHVLRAHDAAPRILREERARDVGGVLHSYSGGAELVPVYRDLGMCFSFAGPITYANARRPIEAARAVPAELLLAETDAPDQSPAAHRGKRCEPAFVADVIAGLAAARGEDVAALTIVNAKRLFGFG